MAMTAGTIACDNWDPLDSYGQIAGALARHLAAGATGDRCHLNGLAADDRAPRFVTQPSGAARSAATRIWENPRVD